MIKLLHITPNYNTVLEYASRVSTNTPMGDNSDSFIKRIIKKGHLSIGRHCIISFEVTCSRSCLQQFVRSKFLEFTVESQRYVDYSDKAFVMPDLSYMKDEYKRNVAIRGMSFHYRLSMKLYEELLVSGVKKEDARAILPENMETRFIVTSNLQGWADFIELRTDKHAQKEIREIAEEIRKILIQEAPAFFLPLQEKIVTDKQDKKNSKLFDTIDKVMKFQELAKQGIIHPLTCGNDSQHKHLIATVRDGKVILMCPDCEYIQENIPECVMNTDLNNLDWRKENG
jgi:thymidylate synthase (FAD)